MLCWGKTMNRMQIALAVGVILSSGCALNEPVAQKTTSKENENQLVQYPQLRELGPSDFPIPPRSPYDALGQAELKEGYVKGYLDGVTERMVSLQEGTDRKAAFRQSDKDYLKAYARGRDDGWAAAEKKIAEMIKTRTQQGVGR